MLVETLYGPIEGFVDTHPVSERSSADLPRGNCKPIKKFLGIPYAQAGRLERCVPPEAWISPRKCTEFGPSFPQKISPFDKMYEGKKGWMNRSFLGMSEDAFTVNVFAPERVAEKLPVLVWVYGGNLNSGSSNMPVYDPTEFVRAEEERGRQCVVVTGNYRINAFGWLSTPDIATVKGHVGNFGLYDTIAMLQWVQGNISLFGGDPDNVTAFGESAGAFLLGSLLKSGRKLFSKLILESGSYNLMAPKWEPTFGPYPALLEKLNLQSRDLTPEERVDALRSLSMQEFLDATQAFYRPGIWGLTYDQMEDGWKEPVWNLVNQGDYDPWIESVIIGINEDEGSFFNLANG